MESKKSNSGIEVIIEPENVIKVHEDGKITIRLTDQLTFNKIIDELKFFELNEKRKKFKDFKKSNINWRS
tara:strand:+ start:699 stop:908 length:210 start_codon:yes stop_codon:yes gene_type:complete